MLKKLRLGLITSLVCFICIISTSNSIASTESGNSHLPNLIHIGVNDISYPIDRNIKSTLDTEEKKLPDHVPISKKPRKSHNFVLNFVPSIGSFVKGIFDFLFAVFTGDSKKLDENNDVLMFFYTFCSAIIAGSTFSLFRQKK
jgi:hypothetical protein